MPRALTRLTLTAAAAAAAVLTPATAAHASSSGWDRVARCESGNRWHLAHGPGGATGGLQITRATWSAHGGRHYAPAPYRASRAQQIAVARRILASQGRRAWPTCGRYL